MEARLGQRGRHVGEALHEVARAFGAAAARARAVEVALAEGPRAAVGGGDAHRPREPRAHQQRHRASAVRDALGPGRLLRPQHEHRVGLGGRGVRVDRVEVGRAELVGLVHALRQARILRPAAVGRARHVHRVDVRLGQKHVAQREADAEDLPGLGVAEHADVLVFAVAGVDVEVPAREAGHLRRSGRGEREREEGREEQAGHSQKSYSEARDST